MHFLANGQIKYKEILSNFIESLVKASEKNKEELKELEIFRKVIEALTETTVSEKSKEKKLPT